MEQSIDPSAPRQRAIVIKPELYRDQRGAARTQQAMLEEAISLAAAIHLIVVAGLMVKVNKPTPSMLLGKGFVEDLAGRVKTEAISLVIIDHALSPIQQRNLEQALVCKVIDRTGLILEIFGDRARTKEGQLQVELAALSYQRTRLVRAWTHLERQRGGFGFLGGPGETQLEIDKRLIDDRIKKIKSELEDVRRTRGLQRKSRERAERPTVALVGYTNAGKSTLFNTLTNANVLAKDMLFATLDPTMRTLKLPSGREVMISDTVGFISDLPTHLVEAFRATLEEVQEAALILHVRDISSQETAAQKSDVETVLGSLGIPPEDPRLLEVLNKIDKLPEDKRGLLTLEAEKATSDAAAAPLASDLHAVARAGMAPVSASTGQGMDQLLLLIDRFFSAHQLIEHITLPASAGTAIAWLYEHAQILHSDMKGQKMQLEVHISHANLGRFQKQFRNVLR